MIFSIFRSVTGAKNIEFGIFSERSKSIGDFLLLGIDLTILESTLTE